MDGQVQVICQVLDVVGFKDMVIMLYLIKFVFFFYGLFCEVVGSVLKGDCKSYQMNLMNCCEVICELLLDEVQGVDCLMVKFVGVYFDIVCELCECIELLIGVYQVSGEYVMIKFVVLVGVIDEEKVVFESLGLIKCVGVDLIFSYFVMDLVEKKILC